MTILIVGCNLLHNFYFTRQVLGPSLRRTLLCGDQKGVVILMVYKSLCTLFFLQI